MNLSETRRLFFALFRRVYLGGEIAKAYHEKLYTSGPGSADYKANLTPVTEIDYQINQLMEDFAHEYGLGFVGEEGNGAVDCEYQLLLDPIDGTAAFMRGMNTATIVASVLKMENGFGRPIMAIIHEPINKHTWYSLEQITRYRRGTDLAAKSIYTIEDASLPWLCTICAWPGAKYKMVEVKARMHESSLFREQSMGGIAICGGLIAGGVLSAAAFPPGSAVETAAMQLIVQNAGGTVIDLEGNVLTRYKLGAYQEKTDFLLPKGAIFAASEEIATALLQTVTDVNSS